MGLVCSSLCVWVLWATGNIDRGDIWDWYIVVCCTRELFTISVATPFRTSKTHGRSVFVSVTRPFGTSNTHDKNVQVYL